jgi:hypothetical protein
LRKEKKATGDRGGLQGVQSNLRWDEARATCSSVQ